MTRVGRPRVAKPKTYEVKARLSEEENEKLKQYCEENKLTRTEVLRIALKKVIKLK